MSTWVARVKCHEREPLWVGNFTAQGRENAKRAARLFVSQHFPLDTKILAIARGEISISFHEAPIEMEGEA